MKQNLYVVECEYNMGFNVNGYLGIYSSEKIEKML